MKQLLIAIVALACFDTWALNKCTGPDGKITYQDVACSANIVKSEQVKVWGEAVDRPKAKPAPSTPPVEPDMKLSGPTHAQPLVAIYRRWADAERLAQSTSRIALSGPVASMQSIQREVEVLSVPDCLREAKNKLAELAKKSTDGMLEFMQKNELGSMVYTLVERRNLIPAFESAIKGARCDQ